MVKEDAECTCILRICSSVSWITFSPSIKGSKQEIITDATESAMCRQGETENE